MPFISTPERVGRRAGIRMCIESLLKNRFGDNGLKLMPEIQEVYEEEKLFAIYDAVLTATNPEEVRRLWLPELSGSDVPIFRFASPNPNR